MMKKLLFTYLLMPFSLLAQDSTATEDFSSYGDAGSAKNYATQKVLNQSPQKLISIAYEQQNDFSWTDSRQGLPIFNNTSNGVSGLRALVNVPVISKSSFIWQLGASYWGSKIAFTNTLGERFYDNLNNASMNTYGINNTLFKPLGEKKFLIFQATADASHVLNGGGLSGRDITFSGSFIYGWKKSEKNMIGVGISRTYRAGQVIYVPVLLWNKTMNDHWGMELLLPARGHIRYNFSTKNMLQLGYELEGNQYRMNNTVTGNDWFIQRGELKPRLMWDRQLFGFIWLNAQAGVRYNWRFEVYDKYDGKKAANRLYDFNIQNPFYFNIGLSFVSQ